ncbi:MAG: lysophospholipid acyltransferase family protein [bacterium]
MVRKLTQTNIEDPLISLSEILPKPLNRLAPELEILTGISRLNREYQQLPVDLTSANFWEICLSVLRVEPRISEEDLQRIPATGPLVIVANHPFGGLEAVVLGTLLKQVRPDFRMMGNYLLNKIPEIQPWIFPVDPFGNLSSSPANSKTLREAVRFVRAGGALIIFPAGEVSYLHWKSLRIMDSAWTPHVSAILRMTRATVLPMFFRGQNSILFQLLGLIHPRLRTGLLIRELFNKQGSSVEIFVGKGVPYKRLQEFESNEKLIDYLRFKTYFLANRRHKKWIPLPKLLRQSRSVRRPIAEASSRNQLTSEVEGLPQEQLLVETEDFLVGYANHTQVDELMHEIGRLREITFRAVGEGSGKSLDLDAYDASYLHLFLWSKTEGRLVGGYRLGLADRITRTAGVNGLYTHSLFEMSSRFVAELNPAIEMGRSFIHPNFQRQAAPLSLLWRGIGEFIVQHPRYQNLFGPVSISQSYSRTSKNLLLRFLKANHFDHRLSQEVRPRTPYRHPQSIPTRNSLRNTPNDLEEISNLISEIEQDNKGVPVLVRHYLRLGARFLSFNVDRDFSNALDGLIVVHVPSIPLALAKRFMGKDSALAYQEYHQSREIKYSQVV